MRIALDLLGGDDAPRINLEGAKEAIQLAAASGLDDLKITLVSDRQAVEDDLFDNLPAGIDVLYTQNHFIDAKANLTAAGDDAESPIRTALRLHHEGRFEAVVSAGSTGAQVVASITELEKISGITRPAVGSLIPTAGGDCFLIDVGASLTASPHHLVQFATMGHVYMHELNKIEEPRIGVLNVGRENVVGDSSAVGAYRLLSESGFNFIGFVEGRDLPQGVADVVVTNGFTGNILLKFAEAIPGLVNQVSSLADDQQVLKALATKFDYQAFGGEPLLGLKGVSVICHGSSTAHAIASSIMRAEKMARIGINDKIEAFLLTKFDSYFSRIKYLRSFRRGFKIPGRFRLRDKNR